MALTPGRPAGSYFEFDALCNEGAIVVFRIREFLEDRYMEKTKNTVKPVLADLVVLTGSRAKTVVRREDLIGSGIAPMLRRYDVGNDVVCVMGWGENKYGGKPYPQANPQASDTPAYAQAVQVFEATDGDPYSAAERAANPTGTLTGATPASPTAPVAQSAPQPQYQPPAAGAPGPWQNGGQPVAAPAADPAQGQPVGGPQGPQWQGQPAAAQSPAMAATAQSPAMAATAPAAGSVW